MLGNESGASLVAAILFFVLCGVGASVILAAASASAGKMKKVPEADQKRFAVESAAGFLRDELKDEKTVVKIRDVKTVDSRESEPDYGPIEYSYDGGNTWSKDPTESILSSWIEKRYVSLQQEDESREKTSRDMIRTPDTTFTISVSQSKSQGTMTTREEVPQLQASTSLSMDENYKITAILSDTQTTDQNDPDRCERKFTAAAHKLEDVEVEVEEGTEGGENEGEEPEEYTIETTTRITTIWWDRGIIEKTHPEN